MKQLGIQKQHDIKTGIQYYLQHSVHSKTDRSSYFHIRDKSEIVAPSENNEVCKYYRKESVNNHTQGVYIETRGTN